MRTPRRPIGAGGWFLRAYAAGFGVVFGIGSALFIGGMFYLVLAGVGTMLMSSDGAIEIDLTGNHAASHAMEPHVASNPAYRPELAPHTGQLPPPYYSEYSEPATSFDPYQAPGAPDRVPPPAVAQPPTASPYSDSPAPSPYAEVPVSSLVPVESPVEASVNHEEPSRPIFDEPAAPPTLNGEISGDDAEEDSDTDAAVGQSDSENSDSGDSDSDNVDSAPETPALPAT